MRTVIYTAIFGRYDILKKPLFQPNDCDFVCFTDQPVSSRSWDIRVVSPKYKDPVLNNRMYKMLPHRYLSTYDVSVYIDGNMILRGDVNELINTYLAGMNMAVFNHAEARHRDWRQTEDAKSDIYEEARHLIRLCEEKGRCKEEPDRIREHTARLRSRGYPESSGLIVGMVILRRHNKQDVVAVMEDWWSFFKNGVKRDQLWFNYIAWKHGFNFNYIPGDVRNNKWFLWSKHGV